MNGEEKRGRGHSANVPFFFFFTEFIFLFVCAATLGEDSRRKSPQLRALEAGMRIDAVRVDTVPLGVDTPADLERARGILQA